MSDAFNYFITQKHYNVDDNGCFSPYGSHICQNDAGYFIYRIYVDGKLRQWTLHRIILAHTLSISYGDRREWVSEHRCPNHPLKENKSCINPDHLFKGTIKSNGDYSLKNNPSRINNMKQSLHKRVHNNPEVRAKQRANKKSSLTESQWFDILYAVLIEGRTQRSVAKQFGISHRSISQTIKGRVNKQILVRFHQSRMLSELAA